MTESSQFERAPADRARLGQVVQRRPRVSPLAGLVMSFVFALVATPLVMFDGWLLGSGAAEFEEGQNIPVTIRVPHFSGYADERIELSGGPVVAAAGQTLDADTAVIARSVVSRMRSGPSAFGAYFAMLFLVAFLYSTRLRRLHRGRLLRTQGVTLLLLLGVALVFKTVLMLSPLSVFIIPVAGVAIVTTLVVDVSAGLATGLAAGVLMGLLVPFEFGVLAILAVQSITAVLLVGERHHKNHQILLAGLLSSLASVIAYMAFHYLSTGHSPVAELSDPLRSALMATATGGIVSALVAIPAKPLYQFLLGDITKNKLVELEDLSNPLLKRIAENAPGTWQHSLAMANMAEIAANAIGANGRLVRVGAYYHDLGKSLQPKYFIENLEAGEQSPHDRLPPEVSCDAIFAHVTEGIRVARQAKLPERIIDFMHMHHGDGLLEYFWAKCQDSGNPKQLTAEHFRYPGVPPQSRETAILAICDAVEAASRTLKNPDDQSVSNLVQRIVYGKLHLGQLDESGLSMADLRKISNSLRETIKHAHHGRIEYPWQRQERAQEARERAETPAREADAMAARAVPEMIPLSTTQRIFHEPRLDSLDVPRPYWRDPRSQTPRPTTTAQRQALEHAPTEELDHEAAASRRADALAQVAATVPMPAPAAQPPLPLAETQPQPVTVTAEPLHVAPVQTIPGPGEPLAPAGQVPDGALMPTARNSQPGHDRGHAQAMAHHASADQADEPVTAAAPRRAPAMLVPQPDEPEPSALPILSGPLDMPGHPVLPDPPEPLDPLAPGDAWPQSRDPSPDHEDFADRSTLVADALAPSASGRLPPPPPGSPLRSPPRETIELMKEPPSGRQPAQIVSEEEIEDEDDLAPGTLVIGPPPATRPEHDARKSGAVELPTVSPVTIMPRKKQSPDKPPA